MLSNASNNRKGGKTKTTMWFSMIGLKKYFCDLPILFFAHHLKRVFVAELQFSLFLM
jgi:hypothetical protein